MSQQNPAVATSIAGCSFCSPVQKVCITVLVPHGQGAGILWGPCCVQSDGHFVLFGRLFNPLLVSVGNVEVAVPAAIRRGINVITKQIK